MTERADGVIELRAALPVPADQRWFWAARWQKREREVDAHVAAAASRFTSRPRTSSATSATSTSEVRDHPGVRRRLPAREHAVAFKNVVREKFAPACAAHAKDPTTPWPASLRIKAVGAAPGVLEMTWSFASPDGRATFELVTVDGDMRCRWRRVGDPDDFKNP